MKSNGLSAGRPSATAKNKAATLASLSDDQPTKRVNFELSAAEHTKLKMYATKHGKTIREVLSEFVSSLSLSD